MRVSIINCVSTAETMMRFSDGSLFRRPGHTNFDYIVVKWLADSRVDRYLDSLPQVAKNFGMPDSVSVHVLEYQTNPSVGFVPNLRGMMNLGFDFGFKLNEYAGLVNTDCYFGPNWLGGLVKYAAPERVINSLHITAATPSKPVRSIITEDLCVPVPGVFKSQRFVQLYDKHYADNIVFADDLATPAGYRECTSMPYLFHRKYWENCGPWELECVDGQSPDVRFFDRVAAAGARYAMTDSSIVYHHEAVERRGKRPRGARGMPEE